MLKNTPACNFWPIFRYKRWITLERKKLISKIANTVLEKRQRRGSVPNFKTMALAVWKLKGKENCENEHRETASFLYNFVQNQCNRATLMAFYTNFATEFFHTVFTRRFVLKGTLRRDQKVIFVKSPISSPIVMPWAHLIWEGGVKVGLIQRRTIRTFLLARLALPVLAVRTRRLSAVEVQDAVRCWETKA